VAWFNACSMYGVGPPAPEQKSMYVYIDTNEPSSRCRILATRVAGLQDWSNGIHVVHVCVSPVCTYARRKAGNL
jgi:hypothetical protein